MSFKLGHYQPYFSLTHHHQDRYGAWRPIKIRSVNRTVPFLPRLISLRNIARISTRQLLGRLWLPHNRKAGGYHCHRAVRRAILHLAERFDEKLASEKPNMKSHRQNVQQSHVIFPYLAGLAI